MLRVMTWNIRTGGRDRDGTDRWDRIVAVVAAQRPDVLALQELRGLDRGGRLTDLAGRLGMAPHLARSCFGQPVAVLVRAPLRVLRSGRVRRPFHHAAARVEVATSTGPLTVLSTHLNPYSGGRRRMEADWLAATVRRTGGPPALLAGDLNTLEPAVDHTARLAGLTELYRRRHLRRDGRTVDTRAVARLLDAGLVDLWPHLGGTEPDGLTVPTGYAGAEFAAMRLDYLLATPDLAALTDAVRVIRDAPADTASDHYPVLADLALDPA
ncbi:MULTISPECIES: endonuclease/exonuclease/phosphatase family protein [Micromonospora]|uniref:Endonuclease/exonuclease/phosphatase family protein n=1 Tax=Micromonospora solifontis TaxID=2487138 RepID=A0ABX9WNI5_9ACTN|nr:MULTISPECIES: endonuclease/exonuclease/phosphatase family protein [Micromonospora]NES14945.1 endonuclease/exonuclease/phosphatase family protein [Micromonospora sp. PPF5-17B]NES35132.1 endonuclease/exonuclease/phosphatase family protein [Micromonospora solifontis]NES55127.1 endonuclease/exonuclease/phosphatase family protein [Micromonospora sp. PPF5-6]RNM01119.1 endonuclease/exonuclease/phosphatase family protein [Micromonospora solifontis]